MTQGRLYKSARATGPMADDAILALPARPGGREPIAEESRGHESTHDPAAPPATVPAPAPSTASADPTRVAVSDFDHIFADDSMAVSDDDELFPWELSSDRPDVVVPTPTAPPTGPASVSAPVPATGHEPAAGHTAGSGLVSPVSTERPTDSRSASDTPVVTYRSNRPRIRLTFTGATAAVIAVTVVVGLLEALISDHIGWFTGVLSLATALAATWFVADADRMAPTLAFPVAWLVCALVPGQFTAPPSGSFALTQVVVVLGVLGGNAIAIVIGTIACYALARLRPRLVDLRG